MLDKYPHRKSHMGSNLVTKLCYHWVPSMVAMVVNPQVPSQKGVGALGVTRGLALSSPSHFWSTDSRDSGVSWYLSKHFNKCICSIKHLYIFNNNERKELISTIEKRKGKTLEYYTVKRDVLSVTARYPHRTLYNQTRRPLSYGNIAHTQPHCTISDTLRAPHLTQY